MLDLHSATIQFSRDQQNIMHVCLGFVMFGVALNIKVEDFRRVVRFPKSVLVGITSEWLVMPILTVYLIHLVKPNPEVALGMLLVAACPGGPMANFMTLLSKGNAALSLTLTAIYTATCLFITPFAFLGFSYFVPEAANLIKAVKLTPVEMLTPFLFVLLIPVTLGMLTNHFMPIFTSRIIKWVKRISLGIFIAFIVFAIADNTTALITYAKAVILLVLLQNAIGMASGYYWSKWHRLPMADRKAISFETGIHNSGLGLIIIFDFFTGLGGMIICVAVWAFWDLISSLAVATYWSRKKAT